MIGVGKAGDAVTVRVRAPGQPVAPTVTLYPSDEEWTCDCDGKVDPCAHVAAAVIAWSQGSIAAQESSSPSAAKSEAQTKAPVAVSAPSATIRYKLRPERGSIHFSRWAVRDGREEVIRGSIMGPLGASLGLTPTREDQTIDRLVSAKQPGYFPPERVADIFEALASCPDVRLGDASVRTSREAVSPCGAIIDHGESGVALVIDKDPRVTGVVAGGVVMLGDVIHPMSETELSGPSLEKLPIRRVFAQSNLGVLVSEVLPPLERRIPITVETSRLPSGRRRSKPLLLFDLAMEERALVVTPTLVYGDPPEARIENGRVIHVQGPMPIRDEAMERALVDRLRGALNLVTGRSVRFEGADAARFASELVAWTAASRDVVARGDAFSGGALVPHLSTGDQSFHLRFDLEGEGAREAVPGGGSGSAGGPSAPTPPHASGEAVMRAWQDGLSLVPLEGGGFAPIPLAFLAEHGDKIADLYAAKQQDDTISAVALPSLAALCTALDHPPPPRLDALRPLFEGFDRLPHPSLPRDLDASLRPYQESGVAWLSFLRDAGLGAVLADDMGLGKTLQMIAALKGRSLVVCPRSVVHNWAAEIRRFRPGLRVALYHGQKRAIDPSADVTLTTYAIMRLDVEALAQQAWDAIVLDEAQAIKNPSSQVSQAAYDLRGSFRVALSGTPIENRLEELWSLLHFTNPGLLGGRSSFRDRYASPIEAGDARALARLRAKIKPFVLRRAKREVLPDLPPRTESIVYVELGDDERAVYDVVRAAARADVAEKLAHGASVLVALEALLRLRQAACHTALVPGQRGESSSKIERLVEVLADVVAEGHKALVFSQWTSLLDLVEPALQNEGISFTRLDGSTRDRASVVDAFQSASGPPVILISLKAGGTGLNLTAADHVFLLDPWWNPAVEDQAADRAHRIGQDKPVMVYRLVAKDTVEEGILALQEKKRRVADAALGGADQAASITRDDLLALLA